MIDIELPEETIEVEKLGEVVVRGLTLSAYMTLQGNASSDDTSSFIRDALAATVFDTNGNPVGTADEWDRYGGLYREEIFRLYAVCRRMIGIDGEDLEKNDESDPT